VGNASILTIRASPQPRIVMGKWVAAEEDPISSHTLSGIEEAMRGI
jgi:hypothetical protein